MNTQRCSHSEITKLLQTSMESKQQTSSEDMISSGGEEVKNVHSCYGEGSIIFSYFLFLYSLLLVTLQKASPIQPIQCNSMEFNLIQSNSI